MCMSARGKVETSQTKSKLEVTGKVFVDFNKQIGDFIQLDVAGSHETEVYDAKQGRVEDYYPADEPQTNIEKRGHLNMRRADPEVDQKITDRRPMPELTEVTVTLTLRV